MNEPNQAPAPAPKPDDEARRLAADRAFNRMKNDGTLRRFDDARALLDQIKRGEV